VKNNCTTAISTMSTFSISVSSQELTMSRLSLVSNVPSSLLALVLTGEAKVSVSGVEYLASTC